MQKPHGPRSEQFTPSEMTTAAHVASTPTGVRRADVDRAAAEKDEPVHQPYEVAWGPVPLDEARTAGALYGATSRLLALCRTPALDALIGEARRVFPESILPHGNDTAATLCARLSQADFLDDMMRLRVRHRLRARRCKGDFRLRPPPSGRARSATVCTR